MARLTTCIGVAAILLAVTILAGCSSPAARTDIQQIPRQHSGVTVDTS